MNRPPTLEEWIDDGGYHPEKLSPEDREQIENNDWHRAGGACLCVCGLQYRQHRPLLGASFLIKLCDGRMVKL